MIRLNHDTQLFRMIDDATGRTVARVETTERRGRFVLGWNGDACAAVLVEVPD